MQGWHYDKGLNCFKNFKTAPASIYNANYLAQNSVYLYTLRWQPF